MAIVQLGRLEKVDLREHWISEAQDFTPWLATEENIALLSETINIELECVSQEERVGPFRADILCKDENGNYVLIENQLERTDHIHLGQLITYAAGLEAVTIIWIAKEFTEEHRAALDWLNHVTEDDINFLGIEVELFKIGTSLTAPMFNLVSKPNDWSKTIKKVANSNSKISDLKLLQQEFWQALKDHIEQDSRSPLKCMSPRAQQWYNFSIGRSNFKLITTINSREDLISVILVLYGEESKQQFSNLKKLYYDASLNEISPDLAWNELPERKESHVRIDSTGNFLDKQSWQSQHEWFKNNLEKMYNFFSPKIRTL